MLQVGLTLAMKAVSNGSQSGSYEVTVSTNMKLYCLIYTHLSTMFNYGHTFRPNLAPLLLYLVAGFLFLLILPMLDFDACKSFGCYLILDCFLLNIHIFLNELEIIIPWTAHISSRLLTETRPLLFAGLYLMVSRICMVTLNIKIHQSDPSVGGSIKIARQLKQVFEPYCMMFKEKRKQLPLQCFCKENKNT